jgi:hypothetical protein
VGDAYNPAMVLNAASFPFAPCRVLCAGVFAAFCAAAGAQAATAAEPQPGAQGTAQRESGPVEQRIERLRVEDGGTVIEEVRYGGTSQSITVNPKAAVPGYEIQPSGGTRSPALSRESLPGAPGQRVWNVLRF